MAKPAQDRWAQWLLERRHGGGEENLKATMAFLYPVRDRVLRNAGASEGDILLDYQVEISPGNTSNGSSADWGTFVRSALNPLSPKLEERRWPEPSHLRRQCVSRRTCARWLRERNELRAML